MSNTGFANRIALDVARRLAGRYVERHGLVTSYNPKKYLAKVTFQPEGQESGWLPIETGHIGEGYGITIGLQPGSGSGISGQQTGDSQQNPSQGQATGDQVIVRYQEGDIESGKIVQRVHSTQDAPPQAQSGEMLFWTKFKKDQQPGPDAAQTGQGGTGQQIYFKNDNSLVLTDGNGATITLDGKGNIKIDCKTLTIVASTDVGVSGTGNVEVKAGKVLGLDANSEVIVQGGGSVSDLSVSPPQGQPPIPPFQVP